MRHQIFHGLCGGCSSPRVAIPVVVSCGDATVEMRQYHEEAEKHPQNACEGDRTAEARLSAPKRDVESNRDHSQCDVLFGHGGKEGCDREKHVAAGVKCPDGKK